MCRRVFQDAQQVRSASHNAGTTASQCGFRPNERCTSNYNDAAAVQDYWHFYDAWSSGHIAFGAFARDNGGRGIDSAEDRAFR